MKNTHIFSTLIILFFTVFGYSQNKFKPENKEDLKAWVKEAKLNRELDRSKLNRLWEIYTDLENGSTDSNHVYNFGRIIAAAIQPGFSLQGHTFSKGVLQLMMQAELAYRYAIKNCNCHGRANIMLGMLYNDQQKYDFAEPYLEKGLELKEGSNDWMVAANQYILAGAYSKKSKKKKYLKVYKLFKTLAPKHSNSYYKRMATMYIPYYEH